MLSGLRKPPEQRLTRVDPNELAYEAFKDAENIKRDAERRERRLQPYAGDDEDTKRTNLADIHVHVHQASQPDIDIESSVALGPVKVTGLPRWVTIGVVGLGVVLAGVTAAVAHFASK